MIKILEKYGYNSLAYALRKQVAYGHIGKDEAREIARQILDQH